jgi:hypothetical protein
MPTEQKMPNAEDPARAVDDFFLRLLTRGKARKFTLVPPADDPVAQIIERIARSILKYAESAKDAQLAARVQSDRVLVRTIPPAEVEAVTIWVASRHVIAVNQGLALFLYRLARAFSPHVIVRGPADPPAPPESEAVGIIATLVDWMASPVRAPLVADWPIGPREQRTAENYTLLAERFVIAHEIAHILRGHLIADAGAVDAAQASPVELDQRPLQQEHEADVLGALLAVDSASKEGTDPRAAVTGVYFFFRALQLGEMVGAVHVDDSHRPAAERLAVCDYAMGQRYSQVPNLRQSAQQTDELLGRLAAAALEERGRRRTAVAARMEEILRTTPWSFGARDSVMMRALFEEAKAMFSQSPSAIVEALAANLLDDKTFAQILKSAPSKDALDSDDRLRRHQVAHFMARNAPVPVKEALGVEFPTIGGSA